jgi:hypothetical protein
MPGLRTTRHEPFRRQTVTMRLMPKNGLLSARRKTWNRGPCIRLQSASGPWLWSAPMTFGMHLTGVVRTRGPLTEGAVCDGAVRCPWHGYDFALKTGQGVGNEFEVERLNVREVDGKVEIAIPKSKRSTWTVSHVIAETIVEWGSTLSSAWSGIPTRAWLRPSAYRNRRDGSGISAFGTKERRHSRAQATPN